jgi:two-component system response regulator DegU
MPDDITYSQQIAGKYLPRLVIADDSALMRSTLYSQLESAFECVGMASDADEAIALVSAHRPDVALLDVNMPGGGAMHATREISARSPDTAVVILSIDETHRNVVDLVAAGAITYLVKGIDRDTLIEKLTASINAHRATGATPFRLTPS